MGNMRICKRCGREYDNPVPPITNTDPNFNREIATADWCAGCNAFVASIVHRGRSAYQQYPMCDPTKGGTKNASP